jgi:hypothetical protein
MVTHSKIVDPLYKPPIPIPNPQSLYISTYDWWTNDCDLFFWLFALNSSHCARLGLTRSLQLSCIINCLPSNHKAIPLERKWHASCMPYKKLKANWNLFIVLFITRSGRPALASVPDTINCRILISEYVHVYIISSRCRHHRGQQLQSAFFLEWGYHSRRSPIQVLTIPMLLHFCTRK